MKQLVICLMLVIVVTTARSQSPTSSSTRQCTLPIAQSPEIRGIRLGMSVEKLLAAFPGEANQAAIEKAVRDSKIPDSYGVGRLGLNADNRVSNPKFTNVSYIGVDLLDEKVSGFHVAYFGPEWTKTEQFISKLSEAFQLPRAENWDGGEPSRTVKCDGFEIRASITGGINSSVSLRTVSAAKTVMDRQEAAKEKVRVAFKP